MHNRGNKPHQGEHDDRYHPIDDLLQWMPMQRQRMQMRPQVQLHSNVQLRTHMYFQRSLRLHEKE